jgi:cytochrome c553
MELEHRLTVLEESHKNLLHTLQEVQEEVRSLGNGKMASMIQEQNTKLLDAYIEQQKCTYKERQDKRVNIYKIISAILGSSSLGLIVRDFLKGG